jgi:putative membrane protein insertion efficiency factor
MARRRRRIWIVAGVLVALCALDVARPPRDQLLARALLGAIHLYQATLSPRMPALGVRCRFTPTCSHYGEGAIRKYGALVGSFKTAWRVLRCGPWTPAGTVDPP